MAWYDFLERMFREKRTYGGEKSDTVVIDIPAEHYYMELALYTASSLVSNALASSTIMCYENGVPVKNQDYYVLNVSPNRNETSTYFWHKIVDSMIRKGNALIVEAGGYLYCADSYTIDRERPILGDIYSNVNVGNFTFDRSFTIENAYMVRIDNQNMRQLISGMYQDFEKVLSASAKAFKRGSGKKYKLHINGIRAGDEKFNKEYEDFISKQLKSYMESDTAVYPEFDGYDLKQDEIERVPANDFLSIKNDLFETVSESLHIPLTLMRGEGTKVSEVIDGFISFAVNPFADAITEALNKRAGLKNYLSGNYYKVDTSTIKHRDIFDISESVSNLISSAVVSINELRNMLGMSAIDEEWADMHYITKNFEEIDRFLEGDE